MVLLGIVGTALTRVLTKQQQYYKDTSKSVAARRELRLGATVLPAELRSISSAGGDIMSMAENRIRMRAFIGTSIICARTATSITVPPTNLARHTLTSFVSAPIAGDTVFLYDENTLKGSEDDAWRKFAITSASTNTAECPGAPYTDPALDAPAAKPRLTYVLNGAIPDSVKVGAVVRFSRPVRYRIYQVSSGRWYLGWQEHRSGAWQALEPLAGPYRPFVSGDGSESGLQFRFYDTLGVRIWDMSQTGKVGRVDVFLRTNAGTSAITERQGALLRDSVVMRVAIRNSK
jgi:hypothetical protein